MVKKGCAAAFLALLAVVGSAEANAQTVRNFPCQIDLGEKNEAGAFVIDPQGAQVLPQFRSSYGAFSQQKVCQGSKNVRVSCDALIANWPFKQNLVASGFTCLINPTPCGTTGQQGVTEAGSASLRIVSTQSSRCGPDSSSCGFAKLECRLN